MLACFEDTAEIVGIPDDCYEFFLAMYYNFEVSCTFLAASV